MIVFVIQAPLQFSPLSIHPMNLALPPVHKSLESSPYHHHMQVIQQQQQQQE
jgi:hypothetical protein